MLEFAIVINLKIRLEDQILMCFSCIWTTIVFMHMQILTSPVVNTYLQLIQWNNKYIIILQDIEQHNVCCKPILKSPFGDLFITVLVIKIEHVQIPKYYHRPLKNWDTELQFSYFKVDMKLYWCLIVQQIIFDDWCDNTLEEEWEKSHWLVILMNFDLKSSDTML